MIRRLRAATHGAFGRRRIGVLLALAALTAVLWTSGNAHADPTPAPSPTAVPTTTAPTTAPTTPAAGPTAGTTTPPGDGSGAGGGGGLPRISDQDITKRLQQAQDMGDAFSAATQRVLMDQATEQLRKELPDEGGVLGVFNTTDQYGVPIQVYTINPDTGGLTDWSLKVYGFLIEICFAATKWMIAFACWLITWALSFGLAKILLKPVLAISSSLHSQVIVQLGLPGLFLVVAATVCAWHIMVGDRARGVGEAALTLVISALCATALISPPEQLMGGENGGILGAAQGFSLEVAGIIINSGHTTGTRSLVSTNDVSALARPISDSLVDALIVKPAELLQYGRTFDRDCSKAYAEAKIQQLAWDRQADSNIQWIKDHDSLSRLTGAPSPLDPTGIQQWGTDQVVGIVGGWVKDHYGKPPMGAFEAKCVPGDVASAKKASVDKLAGALFVALASLIVTFFICRLAGSLLAAQCRIALEAIRGEGVLVAGTLPGGGRTLLWQWCANLLKVFQTLIMSVLLLAVFLVFITTLLDPSLDDAFLGSLALRFLVLDIVCIAAFIYRKKVAKAARRAAGNFRTRMDGNRVGGAGKAIFRAGYGEDSSQRSGALGRGALTLGALAISGGTATTMRGTGARLARRLQTAPRRGPRPVPRPPQRRPNGRGPNTAPPAQPQPQAPPTQAGPYRPAAPQLVMPPQPNNPPQPTAPPQPTTPPQPRTPPRPRPRPGPLPLPRPGPRRVPAPVPPSTPPPHSTRQAELRRRLERRTPPGAPALRPRPRGGST
ncbi:hypothetical protein [Streptomyces sp. H39-S7]|uniref:hypothetical protein n=1 Tax=Streptomyces sp. H39-S7 TaxID=3004357 RepID=UPI0022AE9B18|nr:hypothetical protein [Streptomyces sp. H39-S7]MCZ4125439.1 hypothetical protein [Streptomyces sp. H39-S7]